MKRQKLYPLVLIYPLEPPEGPSFHLSEKLA